jgi:hydroxyacylglutathione hydrolase
MARTEIHQFSCLSDNFGVLIHVKDTGVTASIDAPDAAAVTAALAARGWKLTHILTTHHHADHTDGNLALKAATGCTIIGPKAEAARIPGIDRQVAEPDQFDLAGVAVHVLDTPGHTAGHVSYWLPSESVAFAGDTLFAMGCGRLLEGDARMMWTSLSKLMALPAETAIYCGHEYTLANARFSLGIEPDNAALVTRAKAVEAKRAAGEATLPTTIGLELATNPFLRAADAGIRARLGMSGSADWEVFGEIRERKNRG